MFRKDLSCLHSCLYFTRVQIVEKYEEYKQNFQYVAYDERDMLQMTDYQSDLLAYFLYLFKLTANQTILFILSSMNQEANSPRKLTHRM